MAIPFADRHIGTDQAAQAVMLGVLGYESVTALVEAAVPESIHAAEVGSASEIGRAHV